MVIDECDFAAREEILRKLATDIADGVPMEQAVSECQSALLDLHFAFVVPAGDDQGGILPYVFQEDNFDEAIKSAIPVLRHVPEKDFRTDAPGQKHVFIKGDNLLALVALQPMYRGRIKFIYIDPPYNRGKNDLVYNDVFVGDTDRRRHSKWLSFMALRLVASSDLLSRDGAIAVSIGDEEDANLRLLMSRIFQEKNGLLKASRVTKEGNNKGTHFASSLDYVHVYAKSIENLPKFSSEVTAEYIASFKDVDGDGRRYKEKGLYQASLWSGPNQRYYIEAPDGSLCLPPGSMMPVTAKDGAQVVPPRKVKGLIWRWSRAKYLAEKAKGSLIFKESSKSPLIDEHGNRSKWNIYTKQYLDESVANGTRPRNLIKEFTNAMGTRELKDMGVTGFDFPKPIGLIDHLIKLVCGDDDEAIILDFFAGSGTTLHAVANLNAEDSGMRQCILVTDAGKAAKEGVSASSDANVIDIFDDVTTVRVQRALSGEGWPVGPQPDSGQGYLMYETEMVDVTADRRIVGYDEDGPIYSAEDSIKTRSELLDGLARFQDDYVSAKHAGVVIADCDAFVVIKGREGEMAVSLRNDNLSANEVSSLKSTLGADPGAGVFLYTQGHAPYEWMESHFPTCVREVVSDTIYQNWLLYERSRKVRFFA